MSVSDRLRLGLLGLVGRPGRTVLSALGIAIGITALVGVLGLSESSRADLDRQLRSLGTSLLTVEPGQDFTGAEASLPDAAVGMVARMASVETASAVRDVDVTARRTPLVPAVSTSGIDVAATDAGLLAAVSGELRTGRWLDRTSSRLPVVVLGATAARRLAVGEDAVRAGVRVWIGGRWFTVVGVLEPVTLAPELDESALVGEGVARRTWGDDLPPTTVYARAVEDRVGTARSLLARTANPEAPQEVNVSRPSDALAAKAAADESFTTLTLGLGTVALLVGAVGIANTMVISVLERRREIGVRRALGATRWAIGSQFLTESVLLSLLGGFVGVLLGVVGTSAWATVQGWTVVIPWTPVGLGLVSACVVGMLVGLYPAARAAAVPPTEALRSI